MWKGADGGPINDTILKFGFPDSCVAEYAHWVVMLRPQQATLGALVLACRAEVSAFSQIGGQAFAELSWATADIERALRRVVAYEKLNYLMLMMVDPHVHFHVLPRYRGTRTLAGVAIADVGWPGAPNLGEPTPLNDTLRQQLVSTLRTAWAEPGT